MINVFLVIKELIILSRLIEVQLNADWVSRHITKEIESNYSLKKSLYEWLNKQNLDLNHIKEIYQTAMINGHVEQKFFRFSDWFYSYSMIEHEVDVIG